MAKQFFLWLVANQIGLDTGIQLVPIYTDSLSPADGLQRPGDCRRFEVSKSVWVGQMRLLPLLTIRLEYNTSDV